MRIPPIRPGAENRRRLLPATTVTCPWPVNVVRSDEHLFDNALAQRLSPVQLRKVYAAKVIPDLGPCYWGGALREAQFQPPRLVTHARRAIAYWTKRADRLGLDELFWITDALSCNYFHWLIEALPKLHVICKSFGTCNVLLPKHYETIEFVKQSLRAFPEANVLYLSDSRPIFTPSLYLISSAVHPQILKELRSRLLNYSRDPTIDKGDRRRDEGKVYISRARQNKRRIVNEACLVRSIQPLGYQIAFTEELAFTEQVNLMQNTTTLLGAHGAGLANLIFMPAGATVVEIRREADSHNNCFFWLASALGHRYYYLAARRVPIGRNKSEYLAEDLLIDVPRVLTLLKQALKQADTSNGPI
jgi:capsular polysaccharide biosynthesis protein